MRPPFSAAAALAATFALPSALVSAQATCGPDSSRCPQSTPCCSQYGECGIGAFCLGGCNPKYSFDLSSCVAGPVCRSADYKLTSLDDVQPNTQYLGGTQGVNWVSSGQPAVYQNDSILLTMAPNTVGTLLMSTHYVWYGRISATLSTSQGAGVVTAFIMMSDVKDEIDFEFVGVDLQTAQSNFYWQGVTVYHNSANLSVSNTVDSMHTYTIDWQPETITWLVDGVVGRTLTKASTWNETDKTYHYPQSPSRVQLSLWPAGLPTNGEGTIAWAGGLIDWDSPYMQNGYYYARVADVTVECYDPPLGTLITGDEAYYYNSTWGTDNTVVIGNQNTRLASFYATGNEPGIKPPSQSASITATVESGTPVPQMVPGLAGGGNEGLGANTKTGEGGFSQTDSAPLSQLTGDLTGFTQGSTTSEASTLVAGSAVALLGFFVAALML